MLSDVLIPVKFKCKNNCMPLYNII